ncbi:SMI1/KNR4 family protein [Pontimicrobium sp. MEBiC06410]|jgi:hypothetical protein
MLEFNTYGESITEIDVQAFEQLIGKELPEDYKTHLLKYNGGSVPWEKQYEFSFKGEEISLATFHKLKSDRGGTLEEYYNRKHDFLFPKLLPIGTIEGGYLAMGYQTGNYGEIYIYFSDEGPYKVANSFTEFLESMNVIDEE